MIDYRPELSKKALNYLATQSYITGERGFIDNLIYNFYCKVAVFIPKSVTPNMITFSGMMVILCCTILMLSFDLTLAKTLPNGLFLFLVIAILAYQMFDALDGIHARNTKCCSSLGQVFDAGIDAFCQGCLVLFQLQTLRLGSNMVIWLYFFGITIAFYSAHWHLFHQGVRFIGVSAFGLTEGQLFLCLFLFLTYLFGQDIWTPTLSALTMIAIASSMVTVSFYNIYKLCVDPGKYPVIVRMREAVPLLQNFVLTLIWSRTNFFERYPALFVMALTLLFYLLHGKLLIACVTNVPMRMWHMESVYLSAPALLLGLKKLFNYYPNLAISKFLKEGIDFDFIELMVSIIVFLLIVEMSLRYTYSFSKQVTTYLGYGFFAVPSKKPVAELKEQFLSSDPIIKPILKKQLHNIYPIVINKRI